MESNSVGQTAGSIGNGHYKPPFRFAQGRVPLGNEFGFATDKEADATIEAAWDAGVRYYDMPPGTGQAWLSGALGDTRGSRLGRGGD
jgi:D-threo-aldose 1-dehydrogenase